MKIFRLGESVKEQRVRILQPADFLCERALFGDKSQKIMPKYWNRPSFVLFSAVI